MSYFSGLANLASGRLPQKFMENLTTVVKELAKMEKENKELKKKNREA